MKKSTPRAPILQNRGTASSNRFWLCLTCFWALSSLVAAQTPHERVIKWSKTYDSLRAEIHDVIRLRDGSRIAAVGTVNVDESNTNALFMIVDTTDGRILRKYEWGDARREVLNSVAQAADGTFYAVGWQETGGDDQEQGLVMHFDENGVWLENHPLVGQAFSDDRFHKIAWLTDGVGIIAGMKSSNPGSVWLARLEGGKVVEKGFVGSGAVADVVGLEKAAKDRLWLCGNVRSGKGNLWVGQINANCQIEGIGRAFAFPHAEQANFATAWNGSLLVTGSARLGSSGETEAWLLELNRRGEVRDSIYFVASDRSDFASAALKTPEERYLVMLHTKSFGGNRKQSDRKQKNFIRLRLREKDDFDSGLPKGDDFKIVKILRLKKNNYLLAGSSLSAETKKTAPRLLHFFDDRDDLTLKGDVLDLAFSNKKLVSNKENCLEPNERASLEMDIENTGNINILDGYVSIESGNPGSGLSVTDGRLQGIEFLAVQDRQHVSFGLRAGPDFGPGSSAHFTLRAGMGDSLLDKTTYLVKGCELKQEFRGKAHSVEFKNKDGKTVTRESSTNERVYHGGTVIRSSNGHVKKGEPIVTLGGIPVENDKAGDELAPGDFFDGSYTDFMPFAVELKEGRNVIRVKISDYVSDSIVVNYYRTKPNIHVLTIGPKSNLKYTAKDALDFAAALKTQQDNRQFGKVWVDSLVLPENTNKQSIEEAFDVLRNRYQKDVERKIQDNDYVFIFISSHGGIYGEEFYIHPTGFKLDRFESSGLNFDDIRKRYLSKIKCKKLLFIDACHSGGAKDETSTPGGNPMRFMLPGVASFLSSDEGQFSHEFEQGANGVFTEAILEAFSGRAMQVGGKMLSADYLHFDENKKAWVEQSDGVITIRELREFLEKRVPDLVGSIDDSKKQNPRFAINPDEDPLPDELPIFILK